MSAIFDHLIAIVVGAVLVGTLLFVQMRRQESAIGTTVRNRVEWQADEFLSVVQRDLENMRTPDQTNHAFGFDQFTIRRRLMADGVTGYTQQISFPTLATPDAGLASPVAIVSYEMTPTGQTVRVGETDRPTYAITRYEYRRGGSVQRTGGAEGILEFNVMSVERDGSERGGGTSEAQDVKNRSDVAGQIKVALMAASALAPRRAGDQETRTLLNAVRRATTVRVVSASASEGRPPVESGPAIRPTFPGDPPPPPPTPPTPTTGTPTTPTPTPSTPTPPTTGGGSNTPAPPPPPPQTPPNAPPGRDI